MNFFSSYQVELMTAGNPQVKDSITDIVFLYSFWFERSIPLTHITRRDQQVQKKKKKKKKGKGKGKGKGK